MFDENKNESIGFDDWLIDDEEYLWLKKLPKAELHNHIGSVLGAELIPKTALLVLSQLNNENKAIFSSENLE